jgi:hypothetical protein
MKRFIVFITAFLFACGNGSSGKKSEVIITDDTIPDIIIDTGTDIQGGEKYLVYYDSGTVKFFNGSSIYIGYTGASCYAGERAISVADKVYYMDSNGNITDQISLNIEPDFCVVDLDNNVWTGESLNPEESYNAGLIARYHLKVYKNNVYVKTIQAEIVSMFLCGSDVIAINNVGAYFDISGDKENINSASEFVIYDFNATTKTAKIDGVNISWSLNYFSGAKSWNGPYAWNGYKWDGATLSENGSALTCWRVRSEYPITLSENAVVIAAGSSIFNMETHYFFIECNSGWLFKYIPSSDTLVQVTRLYTGDGTRATGIYYSKILQAVCSYDSLYFKFDDGGLYRMRFDSMQIGFIDFCDGWVREY